LVDAVHAFAAGFAAEVGTELPVQRAAIDAHFGTASVTTIMESLLCDKNSFAQETPEGNAPAFGLNNVPDAPKVGAQRHVR